MNNTVEKMGSQNLRGFTLIEVLVALVILAVGMVAIVQFQNTLLRTSNETEIRALAFQVAEHVVEEAKSYEDRTELVQLQATLPTSYSVNFGSATLDFQIKNTVTQYDAGLTQVTSIAETSVVQLVTEVWPTSIVSTAQNSVQLSTFIGMISPGADDLLDGAGVGGESPDVPYSAGAAPDVIAIDLGNDTDRETSKPLPEIEQQGNNFASTTVAFETVTYDASGRLITEDFATVNCLCELGNGGGGGTGDGMVPSVTYFNEDKNALEVDYPVVTTSKAVGILAETGQSALCTRCCRDHHDTSSEPDKYRWYWNADELAAAPSAATSGGFRSADGDHWHFNLVNGDYVAAEVGDQYLENCRFKRVNGVYRLMQDWRMVDLSVLPAVYLTGSVVSGAENYQNYVVSTAEAILDSASLASESFANAQASAGLKSIYLSDRHLVAGQPLGALRKGDTQQLISRSILIDPLTSAAVQVIAGYKNDGDASTSWLDKMPFYEVNTTLLAEWGPTDTAGEVYVENEPVVTIVDPDTNYYGSYRRGFIYAANVTSLASVSAESFRSNTGIVGHRADTDNVFVWTDDFFDPTYTVSDYINIEVVSSGNTTVFSGPFDCVRASLSKCNGRNIIDENNLDVRFGITGCTVSKNGNTYRYSCDIPDSDFPVSVVFGSNNGSYKFYDSSDTNAVSSASASYSISLTTTASAATAPEILVVIP